MATATKRIGEEEIDRELADVQLEEKSIKKLQKFTRQAASAHRSFALEGTLRLFAQTLHDIERGRLVRIPQDAALATWEPSLEAPPLSRPDLPQLTDGRPLDFQVITQR